MPTRARGVRFVVCLLAAGASVRAEESVSLSLRYAPGDRFQQSLRLRQTETRVFSPEGGATANPKAVVDMQAETLGLVAAGPSTDSVTVSLQYRRVRMELAFPRKSLVYDTAGGKDVGPDPESQRLRRSMDERIGQTLELTLDREGRVTATKTAPGLPIHDSSNPLDNPLGVFPGLLPPGPVKVGDRWNRDDESTHRSPQGDLPLSYHVDSELQGFEGEGDACIAVIRSKIVVSPGAAAEVAQKLAAPPVILTGEGNLTARFSIHEGKVMRIEGSFDLVQRLKPGTSLPGGPKEVRMKQEIEAVLTPLPQDVPSTPAHR